MDDYIIPSVFYKGEYWRMFKENKEKWIKVVQEHREKINTQNEQ